MIYDAALRHRRSVRLKGFDYTREGAYFVTICIQGRECILGDIADGEMGLNEYGRIVAGEWLRTAVVRTTVDLDAYVVMPNHFHGIMVINDIHPISVVGARRCLAPFGGTEPGISGNGEDGETNEGRATGGNRATHRVAPTVAAGSVGSIIGQFKSITTKRINRLRNVSGVPVWQRNYYERIIRNEKELDRIRDYIINNPSRWSDDKEHPNNPLSLL
ncbi:MAG: hypothetical protein M0024_12040 [Nitrospiraceae bacterium]|nr:hypothetical protein [Nitrospiraceae bacterium]